MNKAKKFYVVTVGRQPGIYNTWPDCQKQTNGFPGAKYKSYNSFEEATVAFEKSTNSLIYPLSEGPIPDSYCVDGACSGNPGPIEYRCVHTETGEEIFRFGFEGHGTNNVSEFLAIVHALAYLKQHGLQQSIYSDSLTAIAWVNQKRCNTILKHNVENTLLLNTIANAERWLRKTVSHNPVLKWETRLWGEIPADFGRK